MYIMYITFHFPYIYIYIYLCNHKNNVLSTWLSPQRIWNIYQTRMKIKRNREMDGKICPNMQLTPPCTSLPQYN